MFFRKKVANSINKLEEDWQLLDGNTREPGVFLWGMWNNAPEGVLIEIFRYLDFWDLVRVSTICRSWRKTVVTCYPFVVKHFKSSDKRNGIISFLGGMKSDEIKVRASSIWKGEAIDFISQEKVFVWTCNYPCSWFAVDLGEHNLIRPTAYSLKYGSSGNNVPPRNWVLQGSNDPHAFEQESSWVTLKTHTNDMSIDTAFGKAYWKIEKRSATQLQFFRFFRVFQTDFNKAPKDIQWNYVLVTSGFELWGTLLTKPQKKLDSSPILSINPPNDPSIIQKYFQYHHDYDTYGIIYNLKSETRITVHASQMWYGTEKDFISRAKIPVWTTNVPYSWFGVDFGEDISILPTHYTMRYASSGINVPPRNWLFQASNNPAAFEKRFDDPEWVTLKVHSNDQKINVEWGSHTWKLVLDQPEQKNFFRLFRVIQTGKNKMPFNPTWGDVLVASGFELYGYLRIKSHLVGLVERIPGTINVELKKRNPNSRNPNECTIS